MPNFFDRLREAREGLGLSQQAFAERCGITARSQRNYESGERSPDAAYLAELVDLGVDVLYVLTGESNGGNAALDAAERTLIDSYRRCKPAARIQLIQSAALLSAGLEPVVAEPSGSKLGNIGSGSMVMTNLGDGNVQIGGQGARRTPTVKKGK